mmetsp:Transcript_13439/g.21513  ORF Transcript_13439/g.21513 Transcript_13439/m.21513 type:complete len:292 (-) Transcript_13439:31-906(-)
MAWKRKGAIKDDFYSPGDHLDIQAVAEIYDCSIVIYSELADRLLDGITFYPTTLQRFKRLPQIKLSYAGNMRYDSLFDSSGVPIKVKSFDMKDEVNLSQLENNNKSVVLSNRRAEFRQMCQRVSSAASSSFHISHLNTLKTVAESHPKTVTCVYLKAACTCTFKIDQIRSRGKQLYYLLKNVGIQLEGITPSDCGIKLLGLLTSNEDESTKEFQSEVGSETWSKRMTNDNESPTLQINFKNPGREGPSNLIVEIKGESRDAEHVQVHLEKYLETEFEQQSVAKFAIDHSEA